MKRYEQLKELTTLLIKYRLRFKKIKNKFYFTGESGNIKDLVFYDLKNISNLLEFIKNNENLMINKSSYLNKDDLIFKFLKFAKNKINIEISKDKRLFRINNKTIYIDQDNNINFNGIYKININDLSLTQKTRFSWEYVDYQINKGYYDETIKELINYINLFKLNEKLLSELKEKTQKTKINKI